MSAREAALQTLVAMDHQKAWSNGHLKKVIQEAHLDRLDAALATRLCFGVLQNRMLLDHYLQQYSTMKLTKMESKVRNSLRLGLYQMLFLTKIPVSAAVSESVALTKKLCKNPRAGGMVNGILRNLARHLDDLPTLDRSHPTAYLSLLYSHPQWLVEDWGNRLDGEELETLLRWDNSEPPVTVQVNTCRFQTPEVVELLQREGMAVTPLAGGLPDPYRHRGPDPERGLAPGDVLSPGPRRPAGRAGRGAHPGVQGAGRLCRARGQVLCRRHGHGGPGRDLRL